MNQANPSTRFTGPMGRREWLISTILATGYVATVPEAQAIAACLPIEQEPQDAAAVKVVPEITSEMVRNAAWQSRVSERCALRRDRQTAHFQSQIDPGFAIDTRR